MCIKFLLEGFNTVLTPDSALIQLEYLHHVESFINSKQFYEVLYTKDVLGRVCGYSLYVQDILFVNKDLILTGEQR